MKHSIYLAVFLLGACTPAVRPIPAPEPPIALMCASECTTACVMDKDDYPQWTADATSPAAWKALGKQIVAAFKNKLDQCDQENRCACVACLANGQEAGLFVGRFNLESAGCRLDPK